MQVTVVEALELYQYLQGEKRWTPELEQSLEECIEQYGLRRSPPGDGRRSFLRRTYTCPFFQGKTEGCPLPARVKPHGCLAFNALKPGVTAGESCRSETRLLKELDTAEFETQNAKLRQQLDLTWDKQSIPIALTDIHRSLTT